MLQTQTMENAFATKNIKIDWEIIESRNVAQNLPFDMLPNKTKELVQSLMVVGVMGSAQLKQIFFKNNSKHLSLLKDRKILLEHKLIRDSKIIPVYTLGLEGIALQRQLGGNLPANYWLEYTPNYVMDCIVTYQLFGRYRQISDTYIKDNTKFTPFKAEFVSPHPKGVTEYSIGVIRDNGDVQKFDNYLRIGADLPKRIIFIITDLSLLQGLHDIIKPLAKEIRVVIDKDMKQDVEFKKMFYQFNVETNEWVK